MGEVFAGRYELVDPIGRGGVGAVWRAWDQRRRRYVAAKVLQQRDAHSLLRFVREQALRIDHPHVLAPASWAADDDKVLFTMDLVAGGSLVHLVGDYGPLPHPFVCILLDQLLSGLAAVHAEGVVHRDIKPANLLLEATGTARPRLRLSDFGIAMRLGEPRLTDTNLVVGTPGYISPEQMMGAEPDFPADLFAVGLVALYLLEGAKPDTKALVQYFAEHGTPGAPKGIPEPLWEVVATLLQPDPQARFRTATGARKALAAARELLPEPGPDDELIEIFDQLGALPPGFGTDGPIGKDTLADGGDTGDGTGALGVEPPHGGGTAGSVPAAPPLPPGPPGPASMAPGQSGPSMPPGSSVPPGPGTSPSAHMGFSPSSALPSSEGGASPSGTFSPHGALPPSATPSPAWPPPPSGVSASSAGSASVPPQSATGRRPTGAATPASAADSAPLPPSSSSSPTPAPSGPAMSDTGSFHLPPPRPTISPISPSPSPSSSPPHIPIRLSPQPDALPRPSAAEQAPAAPPPWPQARPPAPAPAPPWPAQEPRTEVPTAPYTAQVPVAQRPGAQPQRQSSPSATAARPHGRSRRARRGRRKPGPPVGVVVPVLLLALACYAVGFWALARL